MEIRAWLRNTSGSLAYLKKTTQLKYADNKAFEVFCFSCCYHLTSFIWLAVRPDQNHPGNLWKKFHNSFFIQEYMRVVVFYRIPFGVSGGGSSRYAQIDIAATETAHKVGTQHAQCREERLQELEQKKKGAQQ